MGKGMADGIMNMARTKICAQCGSVIEPGETTCKRCGSREYYRIAPMHNWSELSALGRVRRGLELGFFATLILFACAVVVGLLAKLVEAGLSWWA